MNESVRPTLLFFSAFLLASPLSHAQVTEFDSCEPNVFYAGESPASLPPPPKKPENSTESDLLSSIPRHVRNRISIKPFGCKRQFTIEQTTQAIDSNYKTDAEKLRPYFEQLPDAEAKLNDYQQTRKSVQVTAYIGTVGLLMVIASTVLCPAFGQETCVTLKPYRFWGAGIMAAGGVYSYARLRSNEGKLDEAVQIHNNANPGRQIELRFSTGGLF